MTVGETIADARGAAGLSVDEVSERTRIRETVIRSIEQDDFDALGGDLYVRGYLRAIAGVVGVDPQPLIREFDAARSALGGLAHDRWRSGGCGRAGGAPRVSRRRGHVDVAGVAEPARPRAGRAESHAEPAIAAEPAVRNFRLTSRALAVTSRGCTDEPTC